MLSSGTVDAIRNETGNIRYDYFSLIDDEETVLLIDIWENQESIDFHHQSPMMKKISELRDKYNLHMKVERYQPEDKIPASDQKYIYKKLTVSSLSRFVGGENPPVLLIHVRWRGRKGRAIFYALKRCWHDASSARFDFDSIFI